jgi:hypothetical protein
MMTDRLQADKQPAHHAPAQRDGAPPADPAAPLDPRLVKPPAPVGTELVDQILADHGPSRPCDATCKGCGFPYRPGAADCPSVIFVLGLRAAEVPE